MTKLEHFLDFFTAIKIPPEVLFNRLLYRTGQISLPFHIPEA